jgi:hypothetical protein
MGRKTCLWAGKKKKGLQCKNWQNVNKTIFPKTGFRFNIVIFLNVHVQTVSSACSVTKKHTLYLYLNVFDIS